MSILTLRALILPVLLLLFRTACSDTILPTPDPLSSSTSSSNSQAVSLSIDDIIAQSADQEAASTAARIARRAAAKPKRDESSGSAGIAPRTKPAYPKSGSMQDVLNWALEHSDPKKLQEQADETARMTVEERKAAFEAKFSKEEIERFFGSESNHMKKPIEILANASSKEVAEQVDDALIIQALQSLQEQVEDIDKASDLEKMGGLTPLVWLIRNRYDNAEVQQWSLFTLGSSAAHNPKVQKQQSEAGVLEGILEVLKRAGPESVHAKAMYALSALTGNHQGNIQTLFTLKGSRVLEELIQPGSSYLQSSKLQLKLVTLFHDLAEANADWSAWLHDVLLANGEVTLRMLTGEVSDLHDKVLYMLQGVLRRASSPQEIGALKELCMAPLKQYISEHPDTGSSDDDIDEGYGLRATRIAQQLLSDLSQSHTEL